MENQQLDRKDLKIKALLEKISEQENNLSDFRVELTILALENDELKKKVEELSAVSESEEVTTSD